MTTKQESSPTLVRDAVNDPVLTTDEAAAYLAVKPNWITEARRAGILPYHAIGKHIRFMASDLENYRLAHRVEAGAPRRMASPEQRAAGLKGSAASAEIRANKAASKTKQDAKRSAKSSAAGGR